MSNPRHSQPRKFARASVCGKDSTGSYDPQVGAAAQEEANTAQQAETFGQNYYTNTMAPLVQAETAQAQQSTAEQNQLYGLQLPVATAEANEFTSQGLPAEQNYYNMVSNYSSPQEANSEAEASIGDMRTAEASNQASLARQQASYGISPTSGAAIAQNTAASVNNTAAEAAAATRARYNALQLGMNLTAGAATYSNTGVANLGTTTSGAGSAATGALGAAATATGSATNADSSVMQGLGIANSAYGNNLGAYSSMDNASMAADATADAGLGQAFGALGAAAFKPSDRRIKKNIRRIGTGPRDLPLYEFEYLTGLPGKHIGVMADEVEQVIPEAVVISASGYKVVNYAMLEA